MQIVVLLRHIHRQFIQMLFSHIQVDSETCVTLAYADSGISKILKFSEPFHNCNPTHTQNPVIPMKLGRPCVIVEIQNPGILTILEHSKP